MIYESINDVNILKLFNGAWKWYNRKFKGRFKIRLQLIPVEEDPVIIPEVKIPESEYKDDDFKIIKLNKKRKKITYQDPTTLQRMYETTNIYNELGEVIDQPNIEQKFELESVKVVESTCYQIKDLNLVNCELVMAKPEQSNNFVLISSHNRKRNEAIGKTTFKSMILVSEDLIPPDESFIQEAFETTECLIDKLNLTIKMKDETIRSLENSIKEVRAHVSQLHSRINDSKGMSDKESQTESIIMTNSMVQTNLSAHMIGVHRKYKMAEFGTQYDGSGSSGLSLEITQNGKFKNGRDSSDYL